MSTKRLPIDELDAKRTSSNRSLVMFWSNENSPADRVGLDRTGTLLLPQGLLSTVDALHVLGRDIQ